MAVTYEINEVVPNIKDINFWEQFTTLPQGLLCMTELFRISKISTFESNSQLVYSNRKGGKVVPNIKDINFWEQFTTHKISIPLGLGCSEYQRYQLLRAIHNALGGEVKIGYVVPNIKDINFWEQFTTHITSEKELISLFRISKISTFESNSQLIMSRSFALLCCSEYQRYQLLRAIHNHAVRLVWGCVVVPNIKDINFWEQFTTAPLISICTVPLFRISKISTFESNSQHVLTDYLRILCCSEYQRYQLLRAIHNWGRGFKFKFLVVPNIKDINFWEQFTTLAPGNTERQRCSEYQRYQLLRAIHNICEQWVYTCEVVPNIKDINFWEQFTTRNSDSSFSFLLFRISKISTFESNSQQPLRSNIETLCCSEYQRYQLLRAIHNGTLSDICCVKLFRISKISTFESNSQRSYW